MRAAADHDPIAVVAMVGAGAMLGHEIGYLTDPAAGSGHGYFALLAPFALAGVVVAMWASSLSVLRRLPSRTPGVAALAAAQTALYLGFEVGERLIGSTDSSLFSRAVVLGLILQPLVAWLAVRVLRFGSAVIARSFVARIDPAIVRTTPWHSRCRTFRGFLVERHLPARAPPLSF